MTVAQRQGAVVQTRHGFDDTEPETNAARPCARGTAIKPVRDVAFFLVGDAGPIVGEDDLDLSIIARCDPHADPAAARGVFDRVIDKIPDRLGEQVGIAVERQTRLCLDTEAGTHFFAERRIELSHFDSEVTKVDPLEPRPAQPRIDFRQTQQRIENGSDAIDVGDGLLYLVIDGLSIGAYQQQLFETGP